MIVRVVAILLLAVMGAVQSVMAVVPQGGLMLCLGRGCGCVCPTRVAVVVVEASCADACCHREETTAPEPVPPLNGDPCGCGCFDVWLPGSTARLDVDRVFEVTALVVAVIEPGPLELWSLRAADTALPIRAGPECCGPPMVVRTTRLLI